MDPVIGCRADPASAWDETRFLATAPPSYNIWSAQVRDFEITALKLRTV